MLKYYLSLGTMTIKSVPHPLATSNVLQVKHVYTPTLQRCHPVLNFLLRFPYQCSAIYWYCKWTFSWNMYFRLEVRYSTKKNDGKISLPLKLLCYLWDRCGSLTFIATRQNCMEKRIWQMYMIYHYHFQNCIYIGSGYARQETLFWLC